MSTLTKETVLEKIDIFEDGVVMINNKVKIYDNGIFLCSTSERARIEPGDDITNLPENVKSHCELVHTKEKVDTYIINHPEKNKQINQEPIPEKEISK